MSQLKNRIPFIFRHMTNRDSSTMSQLYDRILLQTVWFQSKDRMVFAKRPYTFNWRTVNFQSGRFTVYRILYI